MNIRVPCPGCSGTGMKTFGDRHTATNKDICNDCGGEGTIPARTGETPEASAQPPVDFKAAMLALSYQERVRMWLHACFGEQISADTVERNHRFLEESLEFVQACGCTRSEAHQLVDYVFDRPVGEKGQEAGGVMNTFAAACLAHGIVMTEAAEIELARCWVKIDRIREKQRNKPKHSPLPEASAACRDLGQVVYEARWEGMTLGPRGAAAAWSELHESAKQIWRRAALAVRHAPWPPATPGRIVLQVDQGVEGLWYVTSPAPAGLLVAGSTMRDALEQVEKALEDMKRATAEVGGDAILVDETIAKQAIEAARPAQPLEGSALFGAFLDVLTQAGLYDPDTGRFASLTSVNDQGRTQVEEALTAQIRALEASQRMDGLTAAEWHERWTEQGNTLAARIGVLNEQIRTDASDAFKMKRELDLELDALRLLLRRNEVRVGRQRELLQENNKLLDRARAAEGSNVKLRAALRHLFPFVDRAVGEGIVFGPDGKAPAMDALDVYAAAGRALGFEGVDDEALMVLSAPGDTPPAAATVPVLYLNYRGHIEVRFIVPIRFWEGESEWHPGERHFLRVVEPATKKVRDFALSGILAWGQAAIDQLESSDRTFQMLRDDLAAERDAKVCGEIEVRRHGLDPADPDSLHLRIAISQQQMISGGPQILDPILEKAKAELSIVMTAREAQTVRGAR